MSISGSVMEAMRRAAATAGQTSSGADFSIDPKYQGELRAVMANYIAHQVGHRLRTSEFLAVSAK